MESADLAARARRVYESGRLRWASQIAWVVAALVAISFVSVGPSLVSAATGIALLGAATAMRWRGQAWGAGVRSGLLAGLIPFALLLSMKCGSGYFCTLGECMTNCTRYCGMGGLAAGLLLAMRATRREDKIVEFLSASSIIAALTGLLGCFVGGITGMIWMAIGELAAMVPVFALQLRRR